MPPAVREASGHQKGYFFSKWGEGSYFQSKFFYCRFVCVPQFLSTFLNNIVFGGNSENMETGAIFCRGRVLKGEITSPINCHLPRQ